MLMADADMCGAFFSSQNNNSVVMCVVELWGSVAATQTLLSILRFNHNKEYDEVIQQQSEEEGK